MKNLDEFVFLKKAPSGHGTLIWSFTAQSFIVWDPTKHQSIARDLLWRGVLIIFKALYLGTHACSSEIIRKWAPDEYVYNVFTKEEWDTKIKINQSLFHSYVLKTGVTVNILKKWQRLDGYPTKASWQSQNSEDANDAKEERLAWFQSQAELDKDAMLHFTKYCSEAVNWDLVFERNSTEACRCYNWITYSLACAVDIVFGLSLDESGGGDSRNVNRNRNKVWEAMVEEEPDHYKSFPLTAIFWPESLSRENSQGPQVIDKELKTVSSALDLQPGQNDQSGTHPKRRRQPTQKAQELSENATAKRSKKQKNQIFITEEVQNRSSGESEPPHGLTKARPVATSASSDVSPIVQGSRTQKTFRHLVDKAPTQNLTSRETSTSRGETSTSKAEIPRTPSPTSNESNMTHGISTNCVSYKVPHNPTITIARVASWDTEAAIEHLRTMQVNEDDIVTISTHKYIGIDDNMVNEIELPFSGHIWWYLTELDIFDPNMYYEEPHRLWAAIKETKALARRQSRVLEKRALRAAGEWEGDSDEEGEEVEKEKGLFLEGESADEITKDRMRVKSGKKRADGKSKSTASRDTRYRGDDDSNEEMWSELAS